jgi:hypothetical protein
MGWSTVGGVRLAGVTPISHSEQIRHGGIFAGAKMRNVVAYILTIPTGFALRDDIQHHAARGDFDWHHMSTSD